MSLTAISMLILAAVAGLGFYYRMHWAAISAGGVCGGVLTYYGLGRLLAGYFGDARFYSVPFGWDAAVGGSWEFFASLALWIALWAIALALVIDWLRPRAN
jgi:hypothetical protein